MSGPVPGRRPRVFVLPVPLRHRAWHLETRACVRHVELASRPCFSVEMTVPIKPGDVIDGTYVIERLLGQGGMGAVFIAREERLGRRVAIKVLLSAVADNPEAVVRF